MPRCMDALEGIPKDGWTEPLKLVTIRGIQEWPQLVDDVEKSWLVGGG